MRQRITVELWWFDGEEDEPGGWFLKANGTDIGDSPAKTWGGGHRTLADAVAAAERWAKGRGFSPWVTIDLPFEREAKDTGP